MTLGAARNLLEAFLDGLDDGFTHLLQNSPLQFLHLFYYLPERHQIGSKHLINQVFFFI